MSRKEEEKEKKQADKAPDKSSPGDVTNTGEPIELPPDDTQPVGATHAPPDEIEIAQLANISASLNEQLDRAERSGPFAKIKNFFHGLQGNGHYREFMKFVGETGMDFLRFAIKNKDFFMDVIFLSMKNIMNNNNGKFELDDIDDLLGDSFKNAMNLMDANPNSVEFNEDWVGFAIQGLIFILKNSGKLQSQG